MMLIRIIIMLLIALFVESRQEAFGQTTDTLSLSDKVIRTASFATGFRGEIWQNPALYYYYTPYTWTRLDVNGAYHDKGKASLKQEGDKDTRIGVDVNSFVILSERDRVFGSAGYRSEKQENVLWNENIDWKLIAPYVTGDSIGGFLKGETYYFNGGYASESGSWTWGITGGYRAFHNYRDKDPRPRNTASDLSFALGAGYRLGTYRLGVSADFRLYQQKSEISFLADKGSTSVYHMLGLNTTDLKGNVTWMRELQQAEHLAVKLDAGYIVRKGMENIYGEAGGSSYGALISTSPGMKVTNSRIAVSGLWEKLLTDKGVWGGAIVPNIIYHRLETDYNAVSRFVHLSVLESSLRARLLYQKRLLRLTAEANGGYYANLSAEYSLPGLNTAKSSAQTLLANIDYLSDSYSMVGNGLQGDYPIMKQYNLSLSVQWQAAYYKKCGTAQYAVCSLGIFF